MSKLIMTRRGLLRSGVALGAAGLATPTIFTSKRLRAGQLPERAAAATP